MNTKLHAVTDTSGRPIRLFITAGQVSDYTGAAALMNNLPEADWLLADRGYDADWFRETLVDKGTTPCIPGRKSRKKTVKYDKRRYKRRNRRENVREAQRLAPRRNSLRQITNSLPLRNRSRRNRHILVMSPEPSKERQSFLGKHNLDASMSRRGNCNDNAVAESFFQPLQRRVSCGVHT